MIAATLHGPNYWAANNDESTVEVFDSIAGAIQALFDREASNGRRLCDYTTLDGKEHSVLFPTFDAGTRFECYEMGTDSLMTDFPASHEGLVMEVLAAVHGGHRDWTLELADDDGELIVKVRAS